MYTPGTAGTSNVCTNGTGITLTDTSQQFPISNLSVDFVGSQTSASPSGASGSVAASSSSTAAAKSGAGSIRFEHGIGVLLAGISMGGLVLFSM